MVMVYIKDMTNRWNCNWRPLWQDILKSTRPRFSVFLNYTSRSLCCDKLYMLWLLPVPSDPCHLSYHSILSNFCIWFAVEMYRFFFFKSGSHLKIVGAWKVTWGKFNTTDPQILDATVQNLGMGALWCVGFLCCWFNVTKRSAQIQGARSCGWLSLVWWYIIFEGPQYGTYLMSLFWCLESWGCS